jgi:hypothetical protein
MKESNKAHMSCKVQHPPLTGGKLQHPPLGVGGIYTHYQQLPIKVKLSRLQVQPLIEKATRFMSFMYLVNTFQYNRLALLQH